MAPWGLLRCAAVKSTSVLLDRPETADVRHACAVITFLRDVGDLGGDAPSI
jgi:hypothetical protein